MEAVGEHHASVWDAVCDTPAEALDMRMRSELMVALKKAIKAKGWTQSEAAKHLVVTRARVSDLLQGKISRFGLDSLVNMAAAVGPGLRFCDQNDAKPQHSRNLRAELKGETLAE